MCFASVIAADEIRCHVVGGTKGTREPKTSTRCEVRNFFKGDKGRPQNNGVAVVIDTAPSGSTSQLCVLRWSEKLVAFSGELREFVDYHCPCRHVDAQCKCLGCENDPHESLNETLFNGFFEGRNKPSMVTGNTPLKRVEPTAVVENP